METKLYYDTIVIGSGCAGYNAADWLYTYGRKNVAIVTEGILCGTSRNVISERQTYYKLSLSGSVPDSVREMAVDLFYGGENGDILLAEAAGSVQSFMKLVNLGVPFPTNPYGEFCGFNTGGDQKRRATSAGPYTSKIMTEVLEKSVKEKEIRIFEGLRAIKIVAEEGMVKGLICIDVSDNSLHYFLCSNIILATGGSGGIYRNSAYPYSQTGGLSAALEAGAEFVNLDKWQYGISSMTPRYMMSGSYQRCLPKYLSVDKDGVWREFLPDYFIKAEQALNLIFEKGGEWPFHISNVNGCSIIDLIVQHEIADLERRVFLDFRSDPSGLKQGFDTLSEECREYLYNAGAVHETPINRLRKINSEAIDLFKSIGADIAKLPVEVAICAQHQNGGIAVDANWETCVKGLYAVGECAGTSGEILRDGASLNAAQVGGMRAAHHIAYTKTEQKPYYNQNSFKLRFYDGDGSYRPEMTEELRSKMSRFASVRRNSSQMDIMRIELNSALRKLGCPRTAEGQKTRDILITMNLVLSAMMFSAENIEKECMLPLLSQKGQESIGSVYTPKKEFSKNSIKTTANGSFYEPIRPIPEDDAWFERVWYYYRVRTGN